jgi:hypothetical protein
LRVDIDPDTLLSQNCRLSLWIDGEERRIHGILSDCEMLKKVGEHVLYRVVLVPRLWQLGLYHSNEVFLDKTVPDIFHLVLEEGGFSRLDYELNLVRIGPLNATAYQTLIGTPEHWQGLHALVRAYIGPTLACEVEISVTADTMEGTRLGDGAWNQLGLSTWLQTPGASLSETPSPLRISRLTLA